MLECFCDPVVRPGSTRRTQTFVQGALDEGVREVVSARHVGHFLHHRGRGRGVEDVEQLIFGHGSSGSEDVDHVGEQQSDTLFAHRATTPQLT
jgi:hypothetical protein